ncbi:MAG: hypothetical protein JST53_08135 [Actinobacteria bacterium]|nr:hypothetical protein [Actinomycetota bacterium]
MRKHVLIVLALGALVAVSAVGIATAAGGEGPVTVKVGNLELTANGGFTPKALSKTKQTPIELTAEGSVKESDGSHPPAAREIIIEGDKNAEIHVKGIPTCSAGELQATDTATALKNCKPALIGEGTTTAQVAFAEQKPINVPSKLLLFNGGEKGGKITWYVHAYFSNPISGAIVSTVTIQKKKNGRFGTYTLTKVPQITGGSGSIISFNLKIKKSVAGVNPISAKCTDGKLKVHVEAKFEDGTKAATEIVRACTPKG